MLILDNSVIVKWFYRDEQDHLKALHVRNLAIKNPLDFGIPELVYSELLHVLARKSEGDLNFVNHCIQTFLHMRIRTLEFSKTAIARAAELTCKGLSGYDATYLALAQEFHAKWLTADGTAVMKDASKHSLSLKDWVIE